MQQYFLVLYITLLKNEKKKNMEHAFIKAKLQSQRKRQIIISIIHSSINTFWGSIITTTQGALLNSEPIEFLVLICKKVLYSTHNHFCAIKIGSWINDLIKKDEKGLQ